MASSRKVKALQPVDANAHAVAAADAQNPTSNQSKKRKAIDAADNDQENSNLARGLPQSKFIATAEPKVVTAAERALAAAKASLLRPRAAASNGAGQAVHKSQAIALKSKTSSKHVNATIKQDANLTAQSIESGGRVAAHTREHIERERTPGRDGPIKKDDFSFELPDIEPFKGPKGKRVRKTHWEKEEEYKQLALEHEAYTFHELYVCHKKGPHGSPTYDKSGFQLDWHKVDNWMSPKPYNKGRMMRGMDRAVDEAQKKGERMRQLFFEEGAAPAMNDPKLCPCAEEAWIDRVSKDLNIPHHKVGIAEFERWDRMGFKKAKAGEYREFTDEEMDRFTRLLSGASLRK